MRTLINFSTLKSGGGQNVALNFLTEFINKFSKCDNYYFFVARNSDIHYFLISKNQTNYIVLPGNPLKRILYEIFLSRAVLKKLNIDIIYSYFGFGLFPKKYLQITGSVDSNLYYPEIDFWKGNKGLKLWTKNIIDRYRVYGVKRCSAIIFENKILEDKYHLLFKKSKPTTTIFPSISVDYPTVQYQIPIIKSGISKIGLFLCGWHYNKNVMIIPEIAYSLKKSNIPFHFILSAPLDGSRMHIKFNKLVKKLDVAEMISVIGQVKKEMLASLYHQIDFVFLLSKLESFSNNIIEAFYFKKPLIVSDEPWSHYICGKAAHYVERDNPVQIASKIAELIDNPGLISTNACMGLQELKKYPSVEEKMNLEFSFIRQVYEGYN